MSYIEFDDVKKIYKMGDVKIKALNGASFTIDKGEFAVIAGASGAGKSTILNLMGGMDTATRLCQSSRLRGLQHTEDMI